MQTEKNYVAALQVLMDLKTELETVSTHTDAAPPEDTGGGDSVGDGGDSGDSDSAEPPADGGGGGAGRGSGGGDGEGGSSTGNDAPILKAAESRRIFGHLVLIHAAHLKMLAGVTCVCVCVWRHILSRKHARLAESSAILKLFFFFLVKESSSLPSDKSVWSGAARLPHILC